MNQNFNQLFNQIFNKIPHIYGELFLTLFKNKLNFFTIYNQNYLSKTILKLLQNPSKINNPKFYYNNIKKDLSKLPKDKLSKDIITEISIFLGSSIDIIILKDIATKKFYNKTYINPDNFINYTKEEKQLLYETITIYLFSKILITTITILNKYKQNKEFKNRVDKETEKYRNIELDLTNIFDTYHNYYKNILTPNEYTILVYFLFISKNSIDIESKYKYQLKKIFESISYRKELVKIPNYNKCHDYLQIENNKYNLNIKELFNYIEKPLIYKNIKELIDGLFQNNYDSYLFLINKDNILKTIYYIFIKEVDLTYKISISTNYKIWEYYWDNNQKKYEERMSN